jgi:glycosyltransferase involved in cell wall biosynthesis
LKHRPLFICNIANVAYGYSKILNQARYDVKLICHDMKHLMSQPEWDDIELNPNDFPDENDFYRNNADFGGYRRPDWYRSEELLTWHSSVMRSIAPLLRSGTPVSLRPKVRRCYYVFQELVRRGRKKWRNLGGGDDIGDCAVNAGIFTGNCSLEDGATLPVLSHDEIMVNCRKLALESQRFGREWTLSVNDFLPYIMHVQWVQSYLARRDILMACVLSPIYSMIYGFLPYVSIEIGTMREIPFDGSTTGKLLALAYRLSDGILITNPDVRKQAEMLGLRSYHFCPHPLDEDVYRPDYGKSELRIRLEAECNAEFFLLAPARQNWFYKRNDRIIRAFRRLRDAGVNGVLIVPTWGQDIKKSKELGSRLGLDHCIKWIKPLSEPLLVKYIQAVDVVLDQFSLGVFGLLSPKAMSCGKPVLSSYISSVHEWCFSSPPPIVRCLTEGEIFEAVLALASSQEERERIGRISREWVVRHHSKKKVKSILEASMREAHERFMERKAKQNGTLKSFAA